MAQTYTLYQCIDYVPGAGYEGLFTARNGVTTMRLYGHPFVDNTVPTWTEPNQRDEKGLSLLLDHLANCQIILDEFRDPRYDDNGEMHPSLIASFEGSPHHYNAIVQATVCILDNRRDPAEVAMKAVVQAKLDKLTPFSQESGVDQDKLRRFAEEQERALLADGHMMIEKQLVALGNLILTRCNHSFGFGPLDGKAFTYDHSTKTYTPPQH